MKKKNLLMTALAIFGFATITLAQVPSYVPTNGLVGWWPFNGNANDESGNGNNGTVYGATLNNDRFGNANKAYSFDGINDYISVLSSTSLNFGAGNSFTISFYYSPGTVVSRASGYNGVIGKAWATGINPPRGWQIGRDNSTFRFESRGGTDLTNANNNPLCGDNNIYAITALQNDHYVFVFERVLNEIYLYKNYSLVHITSCSDIFREMDNNSPLLIGVDREGSFFSSGIMDDIGIWNRALSPSEIQSLYTGTVNYNPDSAYVNNRGCIVCDQYAAGDTFSLDNGTTWYTAVDKTLLEQMRDNGDDLSKVCVSLVNQNLNYFFLDDTLFNDDISTWDVSNVSAMASMFQGASAFNQDIGNWDVDSVTNMSGMFFGATVFNGNIGGWDVSSVTDMSSLFRETNDFNQDIGNWNISNVTDISRMFREAKSFNQNINNWDVSNTTNYYHLFSMAEDFNQPLNGWDVSNVTTMGGTFRGAISFNQPLDAWDVSNVQNMGNMFSLNTAFNQDISGWDVSSVNNMKTMFHQATAFNQDIGDWDVSNVADMTSLFDGASAFNQDLSGWCVSIIPTAPIDFATNSGLTVSNFPVWGTCGCSIMLDLGADTVLCGNQFVIDAGSGFDSYLWNTGDSTQSITVSTSGLYYVDVMLNGCTATDSIDVSLINTSAAPLVDSVLAINARKGVYQAFFAPISGVNRLEYKSVNETVWQVKDLNLATAAFGFQKFNIVPRYNSRVEVRLSSFINGAWEEGCSYNLDVPCKDMNIQIVEQQQAFCAGDSSLVRVGIAGGYGAKSILWSNGATTKRTYAQQGETLTVSVTDAAGCVLTDSISASTLDVSTAPSNFNVSRSGAQITGTWDAATMGSGQVLIGYRMAFRLRNTQNWTNTALQPTTSQTIDWTGSGLPAGNYEFVVFARYNNNGTVTNSNFSCKDVQGYNGVGGKSDGGTSESEALSLNVSIYPNPTENIVYVQAPEGSRLRLLDVQGKTIIQLTTEDLETMIDLSHLAQGVYMLQVQSGAGITTERVMKN